ncbi:ankyrin repeat domain-containing protein [Flavobacterium sp. DGU11]|uniref:Ankyrin repeat domain-containing protein n=1 Tax=Flavobacterium arundinis TaxID=3139143 RepID=A0ABU9HUE1_9FLAO
MSEWNQDDLSTYSSFGHPGVAESAINLIKSGANPNVKDDELQSTPLINTSVTVNENSLEVAKVLIEYGADINEVNMYGDTALYELIYHHQPGHFSYNEQLARAQFLIDNGAKIETTFNGVYKSSLHLAVYRNARDMVLLLLKNGADKMFKNTNGQTLKEIAAAQGHNEIAELF